MVISIRRYLFISSLYTYKIYAPINIYEQLCYELNFLIIDKLESLILV